ncbi:MAG: M43 family zinc metalloprotease [Saprospiraceae bacterium]
MRVRQFIILVVWLMIRCGFSVLPLSAQTPCGSMPNRVLPAAVDVDALPKTIVTIPVVVHVVWYNEAQRISEEQVRSQIDVLNEDFRALNSDISQVLPYYLSNEVAADMEIQFALATTDPEGQPHSGIIYRETSVPGIGRIQNGRRQVCHSELGGSDAWCTRCFLNIWVCDLGVEGLAGIGVFPSQVGNEVPEEEDGVFIQPSRFGRIGNVESPYDLGRTTTHEIGHYLNLLHPWGAVVPPVDCPPSVCCNDPQYDDGVDDTEKQIWTYQGECPAGSVASCPIRDNYQNFMGYANDACALMFTQGQKTRARAALFNERGSLLATDCLQMCHVATEEPSRSIPLITHLHYQTGWLHWQTPSWEATWLIYDLHGRQWAFHTTHAEGAQSIDVSELPSGIYLLAGIAEQQMEVQKFVISRK